MDTGLQSTIKAVAEYGVLLVIAGIFLYAAIRLINWGMRRLDDRDNGKVKRNHDHLVDMRSEVSTQIQQLIEDFLLMHKVNRVHVIEFSNSVVSVAYLPFRYMTCTYEVHSIDKMATGHKIDRMSTSLFTPFFQKLQSSNYCLIDIYDPSNRIGGAMCDLMKSQDEHRGLCAPLSTARGKFIGYVQITKDVDFDESDVSDIQALAAQISVLLSVADK